MRSNLRSTGKMTELQKFLQKLIDDRRLFHVYYPARIDRCEFVIISVEDETGDRFAFCLIHGDMVTTHDLRRGFCSKA